MTSQGSAITRLHRVIASPGTTAVQIRAAAAELPRVGLEDALAILLALYDREPTSYPRTAARWGARLTIERRITLADAQLTLAALAVLPEGGAQPGAEALIELSQRHGLRRVEEVLTPWLHANNKTG
jgi:hypothetical protein